MSNPFYSIGSRLIDDQGKASVCAIQIIDDTLVLTPDIKCLDSITCQKSLQVDGTLTVTNGTTDPNSINLSKAQLSLPENFPSVKANSIIVKHPEHSTPYFAAKKGDTDTSDFVFFNPSAEGMEFTSARGNTNQISLNLDSLVFNNTTLGVNLYLSFLFDQSVLGSLWLLRLNPSSSVSSNYSWYSGASISYTNGAWSIRGTTTAGEQSRTLSGVFHCGIYRRDYGSLGADTGATVDPSGSSASPSTAYKFMSLTPIYATYSYSYLTLAMRVA